MVEKGSKEYWRTTAALSLGALVVFANIYTTQPLLPLMTERFGISPLVSGLSVSLVIFSLGLSLFFYGPLSDALGRRKIMRVTLLLVTLCTFALALAQDYPTLLALRVAQGFFLGALPALALAYMGEEFSASALAPAVGIYIAATSLSGITGRLISGFTADLAGWRSVFVVMGLVSTLCVLLFWRLLPPSRRFEAKKLCWREGAGNFACHLKNPELLLPFLVGGLNFFLFVGQFNYIAYRLSAPPFSFPSSAIGMLFLTYLAGTFASVFSGAVARRTSTSGGIGLGIGFMLAGILVTLLPTLPAIVSGLLLNCFGFFLAHSLANSWVSRRAATSKASASGLYYIFYYLGGSLGSLYLGFFWDLSGWTGVVLASVPVLFMTGFCARLMHRIEFPVRRGAAS